MSSIIKGVNMWYVESDGLSESLDTELSAEEGYSTFSAEKKLFVAVINRAIKDLSGNDAELKQEAEEWFKSYEEDCGQSLSFSFICHALDIDQRIFIEKLFSSNFKFQDIE